jgi:Asp-tRNA(Asn)/Glu-tRNA(Gln) amidotransferase A subunit family amidase
VTLDVASEVHGAPTGIQLTARGLRDESLLAAASVVASVLK